MCFWWREHCSSGAIDRTANQTFTSMIGNEPKLGKIVCEMFAKPWRIMGVWREGAVRCSATPILVELLEQTSDSVSVDAQIYLRHFWRAEVRRARVKRQQRAGSGHGRKAWTVRYCGLPTPLIVAVAFSFADIRGECEGQGEANSHNRDKAAVEHETRIHDPPPKAAVRPTGGKYHEPSCVVSVGA